MTIPWGDVSTAFHSTGIPNIEVYLSASPSMIAGAKRMRLLRPVMSLPMVQSFLKKRIERRVQGPGPEERARGKSVLWGRVEAADGRSVEGTLETIEGYTLTAETSIRAAERVLAGAVMPGVHTPSRAFGARFVETVPATTLSIGPVMPTPT